MNKRVNILGCGINQKFWEGNVAEVRRLCELMGLTVVAVPGAGSGVAELRESTTASCNIMIFPEYCRRTAKFYESEFGIPAVSSPDGAPIGFAATESWIRAVADATGCDPAPALEEIRRCRTRAYHRIARHFHEAGYPRGATFAVRGEASFALPLTRWLYEYLGMLPVSVAAVAGEDPEAAGRLREFLAENALAGALGADPAAAGPDIYFGDGLSGTDLVLSGRCRASVEIYNRMNGELHFTQKALLGGAGALWILEQIFNAVKDFPGCG